MTPLVVHAISSAEHPAVIVDTSQEPVASGKFSPTWESLRQYRVPDWFRDAKFGIWAHWGPQCSPERGDWYARNLYCQGIGQYEEHVKLYGHPSVFGFKDVIHSWKAEHWDPERLLALYRRAGARYFFALANHHDNFDNWDSRYQPWNSVNMGPKKDLVGGWATAARNQGLKFGVSVHAAHAWSWFETSQGADKVGPLAGVAYDGKLTKSEGKGTWWEGYDPQDLYEQRHTPSPNFDDWTSIWKGRWDWGNGVSTPDQSFCNRFYNRTMDLLEKYKPDLVYFDDSALPLWPVSDAGLKIAAHFYNRSQQWHGNDGLLFGKMLEDDQRHCMALDIERGQSNLIETTPWQKDFCIGSWHYDRALLDNHQYKSSKTVVQMLIDIVSLNGNLLLNIPLRGDGTPDADEIKILEEIAAWMAINEESIHGTRPWKVMGEGPQVDAASMIGAISTDEKPKDFSPEDIRFVTKGNILYVSIMGIPKNAIVIKSLGTLGGLWQGKIASVVLLGSTEEVIWKRTDQAVVITPPKTVPNPIALVYKIAPGSE